MIDGGVGGAEDADIVATGLEFVDDGPVDHGNTSAGWGGDVGGDESDVHMGRVSGGLSESQVAEPQSFSTRLGRE